MILNHGEWFSYLTAGGQIRDDNKGGNWKAAYHLTQGLAHAYWNLTVMGEDGMEF